MTLFINRIRLARTALLLLLSLFAYNCMADEQAMRRVMVGLKLFPAVIAADIRLADNATPQQQLRLVILYESDALLAEELAGKLRQIENIKAHPIRVETLSFREFLDEKSDTGQAAFIAEAGNSLIRDIIDRSITSSTLLFSPFKGDVEQGVHTGLIVSDRILPYVNTESLARSDIQLKSFFLRASRHYEQTAIQQD